LLIYISALIIVASMAREVEWSGENIAGTAREKRIRHTIKI